MSASPGPRPSPDSTVVALDADAAGEVLTLRRAAFLAAGADHDDYTIPPLTEPLAAVHAELADPATLALGVREGGRLLASVSLRRASAACTMAASPGSTATAWYSSCSSQI